MFTPLIAAAYRALTPLVLTETPLPTPPPGFDEDAVTPTWVGFVATALIAFAVLALGMDLVRRLRRLKYREEIREELAAEIAAAEAHAEDSAQAGDAQAGGAQSGGADASSSDDRQGDGDG